MQKQPPSLGDLLLGLLASTGFIIATIADDVTDDPVLFVALFGAGIAAGVCSCWIWARIHRHRRPPQPVAETRSRGH
jgi:drug/metabolite transporter (DMT)-like permease